MDALAVYLGQLSRSTKRLLMFVTDAVTIPATLWIALFLRHETPLSATAQTWWFYPVVSLAALLILGRLNFYRAVVRFMGARAVVAVVYGVTAIIAVLAGAAALFAPEPLAWSELIIFWIVAVLYVGGSRFLVRAFLQRDRRHGERVAIYGAGGAGARLASALVGGQEFLPVAFADDSSALHGSVINGIEVFDPADLERLVSELQISRVLLALPSVSRRRRKQIITKLEQLKVHVQTMPNFSDLISGNARVDEIRDVEVADLLGRDTVPPVEELLDACIRNKVILVTGAGGSIGSELCRQILRLGPTKLLLFEVSELALYNINKELTGALSRDELGDIDVVPLLGSVHDRQRVTSVMQTFGVHTVYHAAAYKHVPLVEQNVLQGVRNNVFGTYQTALAALESDVETFVLVSTDKAVCPTNVMGASKRMAEMVLQGLDDRGVSTRFCMVRFGNVLESSGSVVPLFREQIRKGGPVTVTHKEIIRYFMTIPEAAQLVLQAGSQGRGGDVFVLDMGKPVKIDDLAKRMIHLMGLTVMSEDNPDGDIAIEYTGLRPAEKLYEELLIGNNVMGTKHPMIMRAEEKMLPWEDIRDILGELDRATTQVDCEAARRVLMRAVDEYRPTADLVDLVWQGEQAAQATVTFTPASNVTSLPRKRSH